MKRQIPLWFTAFVFTLLSVGLAHAKGSPTEPLIPTPPTITSFSPTCSNIRTLITLTETNFNATVNQISMSIGDLDGDGKADLAVANNGSANVSVFRNTSPYSIINIFQELLKFSIK